MKLKKLTDIRDRMRALHKGADCYEGGYAITAAALARFIHEIDALLDEKPKKKSKRVIRGGGALSGDPGVKDYEPTGD